MARGIIAQGHVVSMRLLAGALVLCSAAALINYSELARGDEPAAEVFRGDFVLAEFRGCESARSCRFQIISSNAFTGSLVEVRPNGVLAGMNADARGIAVRNRLNALMSNMIHQHKRIELQELRKLDDSTYAATIKINGSDLSADPILMDMLENSKPRNDN